MIEKQLAKLDDLISKFRKLIQDYPDVDNYKEALAKLQQERAELADTIGKGSNQ